MNIPPYFDEISDYIENNITQPDIILKNLYDKHLKDKNTHATRLFTKNISTIFYSLPSSTLKKRKKTQPPLFSTLTEMLGLYDITSTDKKTSIISILNVFVSFFPEEMHKLPAHIKSQLNITKPSDILSHLFDESLMSKMITHGRVEGLDPLLGELPDKGKKVIQHALQDIERDRARHLRIDDPIQSLGQIPASIAALPLPLKNNILTSLLENLKDQEHAYTLAALAHSLSTVPNFKERVSERLHAILLSKKHFFVHEYAAHCLSQLVDKGVLHYSDESKKIITDYLNHLKNWPGFIDRFNLLLSLKELENLVSVCDAEVAKEIILTLCHIINTDDSLNTDVLETLCNLSHVITTMPEKIVDTVVDNFIKQVPHLDCANISEIKKLQCVLEKKPIYIEKMLSAIFNEILSSSDPNNANSGKMVELGRLFVSWHGLLKDMKHIEIDFLKKLYQHFKENDPSKWLICYDFFTLISCFEHLPEESFPLVDFFKEKLNDSNEIARDYAIEALGSLNFSLKTQSDSGFSVLTRMNGMLSRNVQDNKDTSVTYSILFSFGRMSDLLSIHQELIKDVFMNLNRHILTLSKWNIRTGENILMINLLQKHLNHVSVAPEYKKKILTFLEENINVHNALPILYLLNKHMNKKTLLSNYLERFVGMPEFTQFLINITSDIQEHSKRLSFVCMLSKFKHLHPQSIDVANTLGTLFLNLRRQEFLSENLPKELVACVEEYIEDKCIKAKCY